MENPVSRSIWSALAVLLAVFIVLLSVRQVTAISRDAKELGKPSEQTITITGQGKASAAPDTAKITVQVVTEGPSAAVVKGEGTKKYNAIVAAIQAKGVKAEDITTVSYYLSPRYRYEQNTGRQSIDGYELRQGVEVKARAAKDRPLNDTIGTVIDAATVAGANEVQSPEMYIDEKDGPLDEARKEAFEKARVKAEMISGNLGLKLGKIVGYSETMNGGHYPPPIFYGKAYGMGGDVAQSVGNEAGIMTGTQEVTLDVSLTYEVE